MGFTPEERGKYIRDLKASKKERQQLEKEEEREKRQLESEEWYKKHGKLVTAISAAIIIIAAISLGGSTINNWLWESEGNPDSSAAVQQLTPIQAQAVRDYSNLILTELDQLYFTFEAGEVQAKRIADDREAPYWMAIGYMAEVRKSIDEIDALYVPFGGTQIKETTLAELTLLRNGLDEIASKEASDFSLSDPSVFYGAYLDVLIEIPKLKLEIQSLT